MRTLEYRCCADSKVQLALVAAVVAALPSGDALKASTGWAGCSFRPETGFKVNTRSLLIREHCEQLESADCALAHEPIVDNSPEGVKYYFGS